MFNTHFLKVPKALRQHVQCFHGNSCSTLKILERCQSLFNFTNTNVSEILDTISNLNLKSCGNDGISPKTIFVCKEVISTYISSILNNIIGIIVYPSSLKIAKIIPIRKEKHTMQKFRPIALLPIIDKILEKVLCQQLSAYFNMNKLLYEYQYSFKKGCGTRGSCR